VKCKTIYVVVREYHYESVNIEAFYNLEDAEDASARHNQEFNDRGIDGFTFHVESILLY
jgi:hypothetical protein